ncbi:BTB And Kelch, partial [Cooperia oncophora]
MAFLAEEIEIKDVEASALVTLIGFCYSGKIKISNRNVMSVLPAACLLQLDEIQEKCCEYLKDNIDPSNCLGIRAIADTYARPNLLGCANEYIWNNFEFVVNSEEFYQLPVKQLIEIISSDQLRVQSEEQVLCCSVPMDQVRLTSTGRIPLE